MAEPPRHPTFEEYLAHERSSETRHEYRGGAIYAMVGASDSHNRLVINLILALGPQIRAHGCDLYANDMRVRVESADFAAYPDLVVTCGDPHFLDTRRDTLLDPVVIFEVLSPTTADYDRGTKFASYRAIPSLRDYLLVAQDRVNVEQFAREGDGSWRLTEHGPSAGELHLASIGCRLPLDALYDGVHAVP